MSVQSSADKSGIPLVAGVWSQAVIHMQRKVSFIPAVGPRFLVTQHQWNLRYCSRRIKFIFHMSFLNLKLFSPHCRNTYDPHPPPKRKRNGCNRTDRRSSCKINLALLLNVHVFKMLVTATPCGCTATLPTSLESYARRRLPVYFITLHP